MERPNINFVLLVVVGVIVTLYGPSMVQGEGPNDDTTSTDLNKQLNTLRTQLNSLDARLHTQQKEVNNRFNRMDGRLDGIETAIADMKTYVQNHNAAMETKMEWALTDGKQTPIPTPAVYRGCEDALAHGQTTSGVYTIAPGPGTSMVVYCEQRLDGGGWTVFQSRKDGSVNFYRNWNTYKVGFGQWSSEFWLGNDQIHELTKHHDMKLKVELTSPEGEVKFADYDHFWIDDEAHKYNLTVTGYTGSSPPGDALALHNGMHFTTRDQDNDKNSGQCANGFKGAWWYKGCHHSNLNGLYGTTEHGKGMNWSQWKGYSVSMKATRMMFRKRP